MKKLILFGLAALLLCTVAFAEEPCGALYVIPFTEAHEPTALILPNTSPFNYEEGPRLVVEKLGNWAGVTKWLGMSCDEVWLPTGTEIRVKVGDDPAWQDWKFLEQFVWTLEFTGLLSWRWAPQ